jgi:hypothetical protein
MGTSTFFFETSSHRFCRGHPASLEISGSGYRAVHNTKGQLFLSEQDKVAIPAHAGGPQEVLDDEN